VGNGSVDASLANLHPPGMRSPVEDGAHSGQRGRGPLKDRDTRGVGPDHDAPIGAVLGSQTHRDCWVFRFSRSEATNDRDFDRIASLPPVNALERYEGNELKPNPREGRFRS
jgi:hypothetical protein